MFAMRILLLLVLLVLASPLPARAALGGDVTSIAADTERMKGDRSARREAQYEVHEIRTSSGITVRQYVGSDAKVFAVTWRGPFLPDIQQLLGSYFERFRQAARSGRARRRTFAIDEPGLVVHSSGHQRSFVGEAYIPAALPDGVRAEDLQ